MILLGQSGAPRTDTHRKNRALSKTRDPILTLQNFPN